MRRLFSEPYIEWGYSSSMPGIQKLYRFPNGWGASVIRIKFPYDMPKGMRPYSSYTNNEEEWELAVVQWNGAGQDDFELHYDNRVAGGDVLGHLLADDVERCLRRIKRFKPWQIKQADNQSYLPGSNSVERPMKRLGLKKI